MRKIILMLSLLMFGCSFYNFERDPELEESHKIINEISQQIAKKYNIRVVGCTLGMPNGKFNCIGCAYQIESVESEDMVRKILVDSVELFIKLVNCNEVLRSSIHNYPITVNQIDVNIYVYNKQFTPGKNEKLVSAYSCRDNLYFNYDVEPDQPRHSKAICETYEEAKRKVLQ